MAKLTIGEKGVRVLKLLLGLRNPRVAEAMRGYGFGDNDLEEGWRRLKALTGGRLAQGGPQGQDPTLVEELDSWENRWFPIASASLRGRFPKAHAWLFLNLAQTEGAEVIVSVGTFVERLARLADEPSLGALGAEARALLTQRGLSAGTVQIAVDLLAKLGRTAPTPLASAPSLEEQARAETAMWDWYLEWSEIARVAIKDRPLLRELGFLRVARPGAGGEAADPPGSDDEGGGE